MTGNDDLNLNELLRDILRGRTKGADLTRENTKLRKRISEYTDLNKQIYGTLEQQIGENDRITNEAKEQAQRYKARVGVLETQVGEYKGLESRVQESEKKNANLTKVVAAQKRKVRDLSGKVQKYEGRVEGHNGLESKAQELENKNTELAKTVAAQKRKERRLNGKVQGYERRIEELESQVKEYKNEAERPERKTQKKENVVVSNLRERMDNAMYERVTMERKFPRIYNSRGTEIDLLCEILDLTESADIAGELYVLIGDEVGAMRKALNQVSLFGRVEGFFWDKKSSGHISKKALQKDIEDVNEVRDQIKEKYNL